MIERLNLTENVIIIDKSICFRQKYWQNTKNMLFNLPLESLIVPVLYLVLSGLYLLVIPALVYFYLKSRWYVASSFERGFMYFLMFFFFPGIFLLSPFLNFRPQKREIKA